MDWIHCNRCYIQPGEIKERLFWLTNCGHMYCDYCLARGPNGTFGCHTCQKACNTQELNAENLQEEIKEYFMNIDYFIDKAIKVWSFQNYHRMNLAQYNNALEKKTKILKKQCKDIYDEIKELQNKISVTELENKKLKQRNSSSNSTPNKFQFQRNTPCSETNHYRESQGLFTPQSTYTPQNLNQCRSANVCLQQTPTTPQRLPSGGSTHNRIGVHSGYSTLQLPQSLSSSTHSLNVCNSGKASNLSHFITPSPMSKVNRTPITNSTPEYVSQLKSLSFLQRCESFPGSGK